MMTRWIVRRLAGLLVVLGWSFGVAYAQDVRVYSPTELVEMSDGIRADWHRILGKVEGAVPDKAQAESIQGKLFAWLDDAGSTASKTFEEAQQELSHKLKAVDASFDSARAAGTLASWDPKQPPSQQPPSSSAPGPAQSAPPSIPLAAGVPSSNASAAAAVHPMSTAAQWVVVLVTLAGGALGFFLYPRLFQPRSDVYFRSWLQRLNKRIGVTAGFMFFSYLLGYGVAGAVFGK